MRLPCVCIANGLRCTDMCRLTECDNQASLQEVQSTDEDDEHGVDSDEENKNTRLRRLVHVKNNTHFHLASV